MIKENPLRTTAVFYTCGTCNLNCRYCHIDKNPVLVEIDKKLEESFKGDYYFNRVKAYFPKPYMLRTVETWGGEPFLHMDRLHDLVRKLIKEYPYFDSMYSSTNFSYSTWLDQFFGLMDVLGEFPDRYFKYTLQLSIDGPTEINDYNRGKGVTERCLKNYNSLVEAIKNGRLPKNITLVITMKGTLDLDNIKNLQTKTAIIDYYKFLEDNYMAPIRELNNPSVFVAHCVPNTAVPSPVTVADGKLFANFCKLCREIEEENQIQPCFKYYVSITPFSTKMSCVDCNSSYKGPLYGCGSGTSVLGFLPNDIVTACHEGFIEVVDKYKEYATQRNTEDLVIDFNRFINDNKVQLSLTDEQYQLHEKKMSYLLPVDATAQLASSTVQIMALAIAKQIDEKYLDEDTARMAAQYFQNCCSFCIKDNYNQTGTYTLFHNGLYKLLLNGALDYIAPQLGGCATC